MKFSKKRKRYLKSRIPILRNRGLSNSEIAVKLDISERSVYRLQPTESPSSVTFFPLGNARHPKATRALAIRGRGLGLTQELVAWLFRVHPSTVARWEKIIQTDRQKQKSDTVV